MDQGNKEIRKFEAFTGTSWKTRMRKELSEDYVKIDERKLPELLYFINSYASYIRFFDPNGDENANWQEFFAKDDLVLLISITSFQVDSIESEINERINKLYQIHDDAQTKKLFLELVELILMMAETLNEFRKNISVNQHSLDLIYEIGNAINAELKVKVLEVYAYKDLLAWDDTVEKRWQMLSVNWGLDFNAVQQESQIDEETIDQFKIIFQSFFYVTHHIKLQSQKLLDKTLNQLQNNTPHIALFVTFLKLFEYLQGLMNGLTRRHLDFYYREVLQQKEKAGVPDKLNISFALKKGLDAYYLKKGTQLSAGKNKDDEPLIYETDQAIQLVDTKVSKVNTMYFSRDDEYTRSPNKSHYTAIFSKSYEAGAFPAEWASFGENQYQLVEEEQTMDWARIGFVIASDVLRLSEGERTIELKLVFTPGSFKHFTERLHDAAAHEPEGEIANRYKVLSTGFALKLSQAHALKHITNYSFSVDEEECSLAFVFELGLDDAPVAVWQGEASNFPTLEKPFIELTLREECSLFMYSLVRELNVVDIQINVEASHLKGLKYYNQHGQFIPDNPVPVLGSIPTNGAYFLVGHEESLTKRLTEFELALEWYQLPIQQEGITEYFKGYGQQVTLSDYQLKVSNLKNGTWFPLEEERQVTDVFEATTVKDQEKLGMVSLHKKLSFDLELLQCEQATEAIELEYNRKTKRGFFKVELACPKLAFGHGDYSKKLSDAVLHNSTLKKGQTKIDEPQAPFTPIVQNITGRYAAQATRLKDEGSIQLYQLGPFGYERIRVKAKEQPLALVPDFDAKGILMLGLNNYPRLGELSLHFEMNETFYEEVAGEVPQVKWSYMIDNKWFDFQEDELVKDTTTGFLHDGIIQFKLPKKISKGNTVLDGDCLWLKAEIERGASIRGRITGIYENAIEATWNQEGSGVHLETALSENQAKKLVKHDPNIAKVVQPGRSFGGRMAETEIGMINRVSERLRHKNRALNARDYEELILQEFDIIYKVKCFMAEFSKKKEDAAKLLIPPGKVHIAVIPDVTSDVVKDKLHPKIKAYKLMDIRDFLKSKASPFVNVEVTNAFYERVRVYAKVKFRGYESDGFYIKQLNEELLAFLNPWMSSSEKEEDFGKSVFRSEILGYVQERPYVEYVTGFSLVRINTINQTNDLYDSARNVNDSEEIKATYPWSIITSADQHVIESIDSNTYAQPTPRGIDNMELESDFVLE